jgi:hypothetical protein
LGPPSLEVNVRECLTHAPLGEGKIGATQADLSQRAHMKRDYRERGVGSGRE